MATLHPKASLENFPVASRLLPAELRRDVWAFYAFARGADDIADDPLLKQQAKRQQLSALEEALTIGLEHQLPGWAEGYDVLVRSGRLPPVYGRDLLSAFLQDTTKTRYRDFAELLEYCRRSAAPVGRAVLELAGEHDALATASDDLCHALQILNHLQDCSKDYLVLGRVYLPLDWLQQAGVAMEALGASRCSPALRGVIDRTLEHCDMMLTKAELLPHSIRDWRLRLEVSVIFELACALAAKLRHEDPLAMRVTLTRKERAVCVWRGVRRAFGKPPV